MKKNIVIIVLSVALIPIVVGMQPINPLRDRYVYKELFPEAWQSRNDLNRESVELMVKKLREQADKYPEDFMSLQDAESKNTYSDDAYVTLVIQHGLEKYWNN